MWVIFTRTEFGINSTCYNIQITLLLRYRQLNSCWNTIRLRSKTDSSWEPVLTILRSKTNVTSYYGREVRQLILLVKWLHERTFSIGWRLRRSLSVVHPPSCRLWVTFLADRTIGRAFGTVSRLSVVCRLSVTFCIVAKRCVLVNKYPS